MGKKSDKKVKSERVNALRKQYDAFLEEDKKRKERNEYILGRLDNMRYSTTAVQIRHKPVVYGDLLPVYNRLALRPDQFERCDVQVSNPTQRISHTNNEIDIPRPHLDNTSLLKEISKKYILIPKLRPQTNHDYVSVVPPQALPSVAVSSPQTNISSSEDWKSKYDILEQLKKSENENERNTNINDEFIPVKESQILPKDNSKKVIDGFDLQTYNPKEYTTKYEQEVPEKDLIIDKEKEAPNLDTSKNYDYKDHEQNSNHQLINGSFIHSQPENIAVNDYKVQNHVMEHNTPLEESVTNTSKIEETVQHYNYPEDNTIVSTSEYNIERATHSDHNKEHEVSENPHSDEYSVEYEQHVADNGKVPDPGDVYLEQEEYSQQVLNPSELVEDIQSEDPNRTGTQNDEVEEYPVDMIRVQDFTPNDDVKLEDGVNVNPVYLASEEENVQTTYENPELETTDQHVEEQPIQQTDNSGIEAFEAEQTEMFYSEETDAYAYEQQQQAAGDALTQGYAPTDAYQQPEGQDYTYYEGTTELQEQEYPVEINEHEETASRYDQNYEQQYAGDYEQQAYDPGQEQQQYVQPVEGYDQTQQQYQDYEYPQADHETVQSVEQTLDNEQGFYAETQNLETSQENVPIGADQIAS